MGLLLILVVIAVESCKEYTIIVRGVDRKLIGVNNMKDDEKVLLIVSPNVAIEMLEKDKGLSDMMLICMFAPDDVALVVKESDWNVMIDNGEVFEREGNNDG